MATLFTQPFIEPARAPDLFQKSGVSVFASEFKPEHYSERLQDQLGIRIPLTLQSASPARKAEFLAGRYSARLALNSLGIPSDFSLDVLPNRSPKWPGGITGSITHSQGKCFVVAAKKDQMRSIGIDAENIAARKSELIRIEKAIASPSESALIDQLAVNQDRALLVGILFTLKESIYKAFQPISQNRFGFADIEIHRLDLVTGSADWQRDACQGQAHFQKDGDWVHAMALAHEEAA